MKIWTCLNRQPCLNHGHAHSAEDTRPFLSLRCSACHDDERVPFRRRQLLSLGTALGLGLVSPEPAQAVRQISRSDGTYVEAYQFDVPLRIVSLAGSVPAEWEQEFKQSMRGKTQIKLERRGQIMDIYNELDQPQAKKSAGLADVVTLGDAFLGPAIRHDLVQPIQDARHQLWWDLVNPRWQRLLRRDQQGRISNDGEIFGVPYAWGCTLIAYRNDKLNARNGSKPIQDWSDLLQPSLKGRLGMTNHPREFMAVVFKSLGLPINATQKDLDACGISIARLRLQVDKLRSQVQEVKERESGLALQAGDVHAVVGSSQDLIPIAQRHNNVTLVAPSSGTVLWANLWAIPRHAQQNLPNKQTRAGVSPVLPAWLLFGLEPARAVRRKGLQAGASPLLLPFGVPISQCRPIQDPPSKSEWVNLNVFTGDMLPTEAVLQHSEFLEPLDEPTKDLFWHLLA